MRRAWACACLQRRNHCCIRNGCRVSSHAWYMQTIKIRAFAPCETHELQLATKSDDRTTLNDAVGDGDDGSLHATGPGQGGLSTHALRIPTHMAYCAGVYAPSRNRVTLGGGNSHAGKHGGGSADDHQVDVRCSLSARATLRSEHAWSAGRCAILQSVLKVCQDAPQAP